MAALKVPAAYEGPQGSGGQVNLVEAAARYKGMSLIARQKVRNVLPGYGGDHPEG